MQEPRFFIQQRESIFKELKCKKFGEIAQSLKNCCSEIHWRTQNSLLKKKWKALQDFIRNLIVCFQYFTKSLIVMFTCNKCTHGGHYILNISIEKTSTLF